MTVIRLGITVDSVDSVMNSGWIGSHQGGGPQKTSHAYHVGITVKDFPVSRRFQTVSAWR